MNVLLGRPLVGQHHGDAADGRGWTARHGPPSCGRGHDVTGHAGGADRKVAMVSQQFINYRRDGLYDHIPWLGGGAPLAADGRVPRRGWTPASAKRTSE